MLEIVGVEGNLHAFLLGPRRPPSGWQYE